MTAMSAEEREEAPARKRGGRTAVMDRPEEVRNEEVDEDDEEDDEEEKYDYWRVRIFNDGVNTREHVARSLVQITGMAEEKAYETMMHAHQHGVATVGDYEYETAEVYHFQFGHNGINSDLKPVREAGDGEDGEDGDGSESG
eukprot:CAMPEP_0116842386 /NCGR_PEP_ID=MMETSP0418-20121206/11484_1 /TAXON_ID=1158023 /ORGANISM="Astrosyne radiata, Strain 13vi08-1A" /LENGTH=141 /DNA_ID=CAMNT_0004472983 /DNA_START=176 /DNA_END=601 /DNA_ORIENTATION=+